MQPLINALNNESENVGGSAAETLEIICTFENKTQLEDPLKSEHEFAINTAYEALTKIEKEEKSKIILFKDEEKFLKI